MKVTGLKAVQDRLKRMQRKYGGGHASVITGYTASYALYVHESAKMEASRKLRQNKNPRAQWKYLEQPAREFRGEFVRIIVIALKAGLPMVQALLLAGQRLQRESQNLVPRLTSNLMGSAFTDIENVR